jgi:hypothetical protein
MPISISTKKINMTLQTYTNPAYLNNSSSRVVPPISSRGSSVANGIFNGASRNIFSQQSMIDKISNIKMSGCSSCGGK